MGAIPQGGAPNFVPIGGFGLGRPHNFVCLAFSPRGRYLAASNGFDYVTLWFLEGGTVTEVHRIWRFVTWKGSFLTFGYGAPCSLVFSPEGRYLAAASDRGKEVRIWEVASNEGKPVAVLRADGASFWMRFSPDGRYFAALSKNGRGLWDVTTWQEAKPPTKVYGFYSFRTLDGKWVENVKAGDKVNVVDVNSGQVVKTIFPQPHQSAWLSPDSRYWAAIPHKEHAVKVWDATTGHELYTLEIKRDPWVSTFSPDSRYLATPSTNGNTVTLWDMATGKEASTLEWSKGKSKVARFLGNPGHLGKIAFSPDGEFIAAGYDQSGVVRIWRRQ